MEIIIYLLIFIMGTFFGSFFTLAVYRIPLGQDILYTHSYCPNCKHKLNVIDLFPIISYIALKGKCRYCKNKIRIRYLLLEILSGFVFLLYALSFKFNLLDLKVSKLIEFAFGILYFASLFIIAGIDKEKRKIQSSLLIYNFILSIGYIIYVCTQNEISVYSYAIYLFAMLICIIANKLLIHKNSKGNYLIELIALFTYIIIFNNLIKFLLTMILSIIIFIIVCVINKNKCSVGFLLCISNIAIMIMSNFIQYYKIL